MRGVEILPGDLVGVHRTLSGLVEEVSLTRQPESEFVLGSTTALGIPKSAGMMRIGEVAIVIRLSKVDAPPVGRSEQETPWLMVDAEVLTSNGELGWVPAELIEKVREE